MRVSAYKFAYPVRRDFTNEPLSWYIDRKSHSLKRFEIMQMVDLDSHALFMIVATDGNVKAAGFPAWERQRYLPRVVRRSMT